MLGVNAVAAAVPFTPQGAGVAQALLVKVFAGTASPSTVAAYSVGQQIAIGVLTFGIGFAALVFIFRVRSFKEAIRLGREAARRRGRRAGRRPGGRGGGGGAGVGVAGTAGARAPALTAAGWGGAFCCVAVTFGVSPVRSGLGVWRLIHLCDA